MLKPTLKHVKKFLLGYIKCSYSYESFAYGTREFTHFLNLIYLIV